MNTYKKNKNFSMKINGEEIMNIEISGSDEFIDAFTERIKNIFDYNWSNKIGKMFLDEVEIKMQTIFRTKGRIIERDTTKL